MRFSLCLLLLLVTSFARASAFPRVDSDLAQYDAHVANLKSAFDRIPAAPKNVRTYGGVVERHQYTANEATYFWDKILARMNDVDDEDRAELKKLLVVYGWFKIDDFDELTDANAWLIVQHADRDPDFQKRILAVLEPLVKTRQTKPANYVYLFDRVAVSYSDRTKRRLQRDGTQGSCKAVGVWEPLPIENPDQLDERRASVGLEPEADYIARFKDQCKKADPPI